MIIRVDTEQTCKEQPHFDLTHVSNIAQNSQDIKSRNLSVIFFANLVQLHGACPQNQSGGGFALSATVRERDLCAEYSASGDISPFFSFPYLRE